MKPLVRIIKRGQTAADVASAAARKPQAATSSARAIKTTVSTWVKEFQQRSQTDSRLAFQSLFKEPLSRPSET
jgi:hypothetical protein